MWSPASTIPWCVTTTVPLPPWALSARTVPFLFARRAVASPACAVHAVALPLFAPARIPSSRKVADEDTRPQRRLRAPRRRFVQARPRPRDEPEGHRALHRHGPPRLDHLRQLRTPLRHPPHPLRPPAPRPRRPRLPPRRPPPRPPPL